MALLPISTGSYANFRTDALIRAMDGLGYNVDDTYGYQCWDLAAELWQNIGFGGGYPQTGPNSYAMECWTVSRDINKGDKFYLITRKSDLKIGDVIVLGVSSISDTGHIAFCDENYNGTDNMDLLGQNQVNPNLTTGHIPTVTNIDISAFLGAFRYKEWNDAPVPPSPTSSRRSKFPWVLYARKLRNRR